jgi:hypothetical protein
MIGPIHVAIVNYCGHKYKVYNYLQVPEKVFREMRSTMVKGIWFNRHIKGKYRLKK